MEPKFRKTVLFDFLVLWPAMLVASTQWAIAPVLEWLINAAGVFLLVVSVFLLYKSEDIINTFTVNRLRSNKFRIYTILSTSCEVLFMLYIGWYWTALGWGVGLVTIQFIQYHGHRKLIVDSVLNSRNNP